MDAREFFNPEVMYNFGSGESYGDWTHSYWDLEFVAATVNSSVYSLLEEWGTDESRTCELCGTVHHTNEFGIVYFCKNEDCTEIRKFFGYTSAKRPLLACGAPGPDRSKRAQWVKKMLRDLYDAPSIHCIPLESKMACLYSMKLARMANEHSRIGSAAEVTDLQPTDRQTKNEVVATCDSGIY